jgi:hypothetical protein
MASFPALERRYSVIRMLSAGLRQPDRTSMVIEQSDRTIHGITAKELLHIHPRDLDNLQGQGYTLAKSVNIQVSAKAAREFILEIYNLAQNTTIGFCRDRAAIWFRDPSVRTLWNDGRLTDLPIENLGWKVASRARQFADAIGAKLSKLSYLQRQGQEPCILVSMEPMG